MRAIALLRPRVRLESFKGKGAWLRVVMDEGRKRQIREIGSRIGLPIVKIIRLRIHTLHLGTLKPGQSRPPDQERGR